MGQIQKARASRQATKLAAPAPAAPRHVWRMLALWALLLAAYSNSFDSGLVFDNAAIIAQDPRIQTVTSQNIGLILTKEYWYSGPQSLPISGLYRPLTTFSYLLNYAVFGNGVSPEGYHLVNLVLQGVNVTLLYILGILVFGESALAWALAAIWGLHPLLTESVTNIVGRADLLAALGVLAGLLCHVKGAVATGWRKLAWLAGLFAAQAAGLFSKESAAVLPAIMLLYDLTWPRRATWRGRLPGYLALLLPFAGFFYLRFQLHSVFKAGEGVNPLIGAGFWTARLTAIKVIGKFVWLYLWPARLSADYSYNAIPLFAWHISWEDLKAVVALAVCIGLGLLAILSYRQRKPLCFFLLFFFVTMSPTSNLVVLIGSIMGERFIYLPSIGLAGCLVLGVYALGRRLSPRWPYAAQAAWLSMALVCLAFAARTYARNFDWYDQLTLWSSAANACPESFKTHYNLGNALMRAGRLPEARAEYQAALRVKFNYADAHLNLGVVLSQMPGHLPEAVAEYLAALRLNPYSMQAHTNLGNALLQIPGRLNDAIAEYETALRIQPDLVQAQQGLQAALRLQDMKKDSVRK